MIRGLGSLAQLPTLAAAPCFNHVAAQSSTSTAVPGACAAGRSLWSYLKTLSTLSSPPLAPTNATSPSVPSRALLDTPQQPHPQHHLARSFQTSTGSCITRLYPHSFNPPATLPKFKRLPKNPDDVKWRRMVLRFPPAVDVKLDDHMLTLTGRAGSVRVNLKHMDPTGAVGMQVYQQAVQDASGQATTHTLMLCVSPTRHYFRGIATHIDNQIHGVLQGYLQGITLKGVGYRFEPVEAPQTTSKPYFDTSPQEKQNVAYPVQKALQAVRLKVGYTFTKVVPLPDDLRAFIIRPTLMYIYGLERHRVRNAAMHIRKVQPPNPFTGNGIRLLDEDVKLRPRGSSK